MKSLWGGRFKKGMHPVLKCFSYSLHVDGELLEAELQVNHAWVKTLAKAGLITRAEAAKMTQGLQAVEKQYKGKALCEYVKEFEDVHTLVQSALEKKIGNLGKKIHTGRSRNDLVITSTRVWLREKIAVLENQITKTQKALVYAAGKAGNSLIAGMTHLQKAQPVLMAHHLLAYVEMLQEDLERLHDVQKRVDVLPLGSAALAGSALELDRKFLAKELGFSKVASNSMAATSDRGFLAEFLSVLAILWTHLSRLSEDFILWNSEAFDYIELDDSFATGSSLMPQKKNPDVFELVRGRSAGIFGALQSLLVVQKGLPLAYNRDLQDDKPPVFEAFRKTFGALELLALTISSISFNFKAMEASVQDDNLFATDILEYLVRKGVTFSEAHEIVGNAVRYAQENGTRLRNIRLADWKKFSPKFDSGVYGLFDAQASVRGKKTYGSTNPAMVQQQIQKWKKQLK